MDLISMMDSEKIKNIWVKFLRRTRWVLIINFISEFKLL